MKENPGSPVLGLLWLLGPGPLVGLGPLVLLALGSLVALGSRVFGCSWFFGPWLLLVLGSFVKMIFCLIEKIQREMNLFGKHDKIAAFVS